MNTSNSLVAPAKVMVQSNSIREFKTGVDELLSKRQYFISKVLPQLIEGQDYYVIKGRKSLAKGGAEKIASIYGFTASFEQDNDTMKSFESVKGLIAFICNLYKGNQKVGQGRGASTLAKNDNDPNKTIKMCQKSAYIDSLIRCSGLSDIFTQDLEVMPVEAISEPPQQEEYQVIEEDPKLATEKQRTFLLQLIYEKCSKASREEYLSQLNSPNLSRFDCSELISSLLPM